MNGYRVVIDGDWQYGLLDGSNRFIVYHPKNRKVQQVGVSPACLS